jgi:hypothetical protein
MRRTFVGLLTALLMLPSIAQSASAPPYNPPFGAWRIPKELYGSVPFNLNALAFAPPRDSPADLLAALDAARAKKMHVFASLVGFAQPANNPDGSFSLANWQARYNVWCPAGHCVNLQPYVADGTLLAVHLFEYSKPPNPIENYTPTLDQIRQIAAYVKTLWPYLPTLIDTSHACMFVGEPWSHADLDLVTITFFTNGMPDFARGEAAIDKNVACAKQAGLSYMLSPNPFGGAQNGLSPNSLASFRHFTEFALLYPGTKATDMWRWWPDNTPTVTNGRKTFANFWSEQLNPGVGAVMREVEACAANPTPANCPAGRRGGTP